MTKKYHARIIHDHYIILASGKEHHFIKDEILSIRELNTMKNKFGLEAKDYIIEETK